jgi:hypothetical protein
MSNTQIKTCTNDVNENTGGADGVLTSQWGIHRTGLILHRRRFRPVAYLHYFTGADEDGGVLNYTDF